MERLANQSLLAVQGADPYLQSHPLPAERVATLESLVKKSKFVGRTDPPELQRRHDLVRAKLIAFTMTPQQVGRRYAASDTSLPARYARAIAAYRTGALGPALKLIDGLIQSEPKNAYFWELKGQALLEGGRPAEAAAPLRQAVSLAPRSGLLRIMLGQALVASGSKAGMEEAIKNLSVGLQSDPDVPNGYRFLARAYALKNDLAMADLATAQGLFAEGNVKEAQARAARAQAKLKPGSPAWLRADDIVSYKLRKKR
jgi:predicted Zn-dependent protease